MIYRQEQDYCGGRSAVALGKFDGVHIGHSALIGRAAEWARANGAETVAVTFESHPYRLLCPEKEPPALTELEEKLALIERAGARHVVARAFTSELAGLDPLEYLDMLCGALRPAAIFAGESYSFGAQGRGSVETLVACEARYGYRTIAVEPVNYAGRPVSSTRIRSALSFGDILSVNDMLGRRYALPVRWSEGRAFAAEGRALPGDGLYMAEDERGRRLCVHLRAGGMEGLPEGAQKISFLEGSS